VAQLPPRADFDSSTVSKHCSPFRKTPQRGQHRALAQRPGIPAGFSVSGRTPARYHVPKVTTMAESEVQDGFSPVEVFKLSNSLNCLLADCYALYIKTKNFHWHMSGPHFRDWHLMLDDQATQIYDITDDIAERVRKIGCTTIRSIGQIARLAKIKDCDDAGIEPKAMLLELLADNRTLITRLRSCHAVTESVGDYASTALIEVWIDEAERRAWFLFEATR